MGLDTNAVKLLLYARSKGVCFTETATIGRHGLHLPALSLKKALRDFGYSSGDEEVIRLFTEGDSYAEPFLKRLGATKVCSFDISNYEGASVICDFNFPVPENFKNRFDVVLDAGSLEHVFNFPVAVRNCMEMLKVGGHFLGVSPANNLFGHGFYQFSPELFFRVFTANNGFEVMEMFAFEDLPTAKWFKVADPDAVKRRVTLVNARPTSLAVIARKIETTPIFASPPYQSDYTILWESNTEPPAWGSPFETRWKWLSQIAPKVAHRVPPSAHSCWRRLRHYHDYISRFHRKFFTRAQIPSWYGLLVVGFAL